MRPIEPGCKAITVNTYFKWNNNKLVTVIKCLGAVEGWVNTKGPRWEIDTALTAVDGEKVYHVPEGQLRRVDDDYGKTTTWESCIWQPNKDKVVNE